MEKPILEKKISEKSKTITGIKEELIKESKKEKVNYLSTGCTLLDLVVGGGLGLGFPAGKIINIVGDKSSGKTFLATEIIAANYYKFKNKLKYNFDDGESGFTFDTKHLYGFDIFEEKPYSSSTIEEWDVNVQRFLDTLKKDDIGIYVLDSLDGLSDEEKEERAKDRFNKAKKGKVINNEGTYGTKTPKFLSQEFFKTKTSQISEKNALLVIISQVRDNLDPFSFKKHKRNGGRALDFYAHTCLWLANVSKIKKKDRVIGVLVEAKTDKSKTPRPYRTCRFIVYFDYGLDDIGSNLNFLYDCWGKDGRLKTNAQSIPWNSKKEETLSNIKEFLIEKNLLDNYKKDKKDDSNCGEFSPLEYIKNWIQKKDSLYKEYKKIFGESESYEELVKKISESPEMQETLKQRVIDKWEELEKEIIIDRRRKYE